MTSVAVVPVVLEQTITNVDISIDNFTLNATEGNATVYKRSADSKILDVVYVPIPPSVWTTWGQQDDYIIDYVLGELGMTRA